MKEKGDKKMKEKGKKMEEKEGRKRNYKKGTDPFIDEMLDVIDNLFSKARADMGLK